MGYSLKKISKKIMLIFIAFISMFIYIGNAKAANVGDKYYLTYKYNTNPTGGNPFTYYNNKTDYNYYDINQQLDWSTNFKVEVVVRYDYSFQKIFLVGTEKIGGTTGSNNGLAISLTDDARVYVEAAGRSATSTNAVIRNRIKVLFEWDASNNTAKTTVYEYSGTSFDSGRSFSFTTYPITTNSHSYSAKNLRIGRGYEDSVPYKLLYESFDYSKQYSYDPNNGAELIAPTRINRGYVFRRWCSSSSCNNVYGDSVIMDSDKTAYSQYYDWNVDSTAGTPYMYGGETKIYGSGETIITTNVNNLDYPPGVNKYYSCGYSTDGTNFDHFTEPSTNNTFVVGATEYLGTRNYACYAYASDGFDSTPIMFVVADPDYYQAIVTILLPSIDFNTGDGVIPGDTARFYGKYNTSNLYDTETGDNIVDVPIGFLDGHKFLGWYTSDDSSGEKIIDSEGNFVPNVSGWTNEDGKFIKTSNSTLYARYKEIKEAYLIEGSTINGKFDKTNTTEFRRATLEEYNAATLTDDNIISTNDSPNVVYMWNTTIDSKVVTLYYTEADFMYMNSDSSHMFLGLKNITELDLSSFDVSNVTTMVGMFNSCPLLQELDLSSFDTRKVGLMGSMFAYCTKLTTIYVSNKWSTNGLNYNANQSTMFAGDIRIMGYLGSKYDYYWHGAEKARIDGGPGNEGYLTDISHKGETHRVTFPDNSVRVYNHNSIVYLDKNETNLGTYTSGEITFKYHNGNIDTTSNQVFEMAGDGFACDDKHYKDNGEIRVNSDKVIEYAYKPVITNSVFPENPEKDGYIFMGWFTEEEGGEKYTKYTGDEPIVLHAQYELPNSYLMSGSDINDKINYVTDDSSINEFRRGTIEEYNQAKDSFDDNYNIISTDESPLPTYMWYDGENILYYSEAENIYMNADSSNMFSYTYASSIDVTEFDTSNVTNMSYMFSSGGMTELDLSHFNTSNVTNMTGMFDGCSSLQTIYVSNNWSTESLEDGNGEYMFSNDGNLVGSSGTTYDENHTDEEYARPDEGVDNPGYLTLVTFYNVTYPNSSTRSYKDGTVINLGENDSPAIIETAGTITFKYHDDETEDTTLTKITTKIPNGFIVNGNHIDDNEDITINEDKVIEYDYDEEVTGDEFPVPTRENYIFLGWYTEEVDGDLVENYNGKEDITLHAHWQADTVTITKPDEVIEVPKGSEYNLGVNDLYDFYAEAEYVYLDYNLGDDSDPPMTMMAEYKKGNGWLIDGVHYDDNSVITVTEPITIEYDYVIDKPPYVLPHPTNGNKYFAGWYAWGDFDSEPYEEYYGGGDITFVAKWIDDPVNLTIDGKTKVVERGSEYVVPSGQITDDNYITIYVSDRDKDREPVKIGYGKTVNYQNINGNNYEPGYKYIVNEDTTIITNTNNAEEVIMNPYIERPTSYEDEYGSYIFVGWILGNWDYVDPTDVNTDIYTLTPEDRNYNGQEFLAEYQMFNPETNVKVHIIDEFRRNDYIKIYEKGSTFNLEEDSRESNLHFDVGNNINDDYFTYEKHAIATVDHYLVNGESYDPNTTITLNEDIELEYVRVITSTESCGDEDCPDTINLNPNSRYNDYIYRGTYTNKNGEGSLVDVKNTTPMGDSYGGLYQTVYQYFIDGTNNIILTVDEDVSIIPKGMGVIPEAKEKEDDVIPITLVYQDNETPNGVVNMTYRHTFEGYRKQNYWRVYNPGEEYDYEEDTYFNSSYNSEWIFDDLPEIDDDHFKGWWTEPEGGERVDELEYMRGYYEDYGYDTLYAHWGEPTVEICHGKGDCEEIIKGTAVVLERPEPTVTTAHFTLDYNTEEPGYDPKNVTTTRTDTVEYFMINDERYDFGETYVFNENVDMYGVTTTVYTSDFEGYYSDNWDYGLNINGYELRGWCATTDGRYCRYYDEDEDIVQPDGLTLYASYWSSEGDTVQVTVDWNTTYDWPKGESEVLPDEKYNTIDFEVPEDYDRNIYFERNDGSGETLNGSIHVTNEFIGYRVGNDDSRRYQRHDLYTFYKDIHIQSQYDEVYQEITFPEMNEPTFKGWYTRPEGGRKISTTEDFVKYMDLYNEFHLYAQYYEGLPTDMELDTDNVSLMPGETHQIGVIFTPEGHGDTLTYTGYDDTKISVVNGLITGLSEGTTTITVGTENTDIEKTINVTIINGTFASSTYSVLDKEKEDQTTDRIIIGAEPETLISDFKSNLDNPSEYIKIYDGDNELSDDDIVKTGLTIRLEVNGTIYDEATIIIRGDINQDGLVNLMDKSVLSEQLLRLSDIEGYGVYAADIDNNDSINLMDKSKLSEYLLRLIDTLNE